MEVPRQQASAFNVSRWVCQIWRARTDVLGPAAFVWCGFFLLSIQLLLFVHNYGADLPYYDEWEMIPVLTGHEPISLKWLWSQHNEHRILLGRLVYLSVLRLADFDFRVMHYVEAAILMAVSAALIAGARHLRGRADYPDVFLPAVVLSVSQTENVIWGFQISFVIPSAMALLVLLLCVYRTKIGFYSALAIAVASVASPLFGGNGLALAPALAVCTTVNGWQLRKGSRGWVKAAWLWTIAVLAAAVCVFYFVDYSRPSKHPPSHLPRQIAEWGQNLVICGLGIGVQTVKELAISALLALAAATAAMLLVVFVTRPSERYRVIRLVLVFGALGSLVIGTSWARSVFGVPAAYASRYVTLMCPIWCAFYFAWQLPRSAVLGRSMQMVIFSAAIALLIPNSDKATAEATGLLKDRQALLSDLKSGVRLTELGRRYTSLYYGGQDVLIERMKMLRARGLARWRWAKD